MQCGKLIGKLARVRELTRTIYSVQASAPKASFRQDLESISVKNFGNWRSSDCHDQIHSPPLMQVPFHRHEYHTRVKGP